MQGGETRCLVAHQVSSEPTSAVRGRTHGICLPPLACDCERLSVDYECEKATVLGHRLHCIEVACDQHAIRLNYEITPEPLTADAEQGEPRFLSWAWWAEDDLENTYAEAGDAYSGLPAKRGRRESSP
jgi:hypothetical protein